MDSRDALMGVAMFETHLKIMETYRITLPAFALEVTAASKEEALERFWFDFDHAQLGPDFGSPIMKVIKKRAWTKKLK